MTCFAIELKEIRQSLDMLYTVKQISFQVNWVNTQVFYVPVRLPTQTIVILSTILVNTDPIPQSFFVND